MGGEEGGWGVGVEHEEMRWTKFILEVKNNKFSHTSLACKMIDENTIRKKSLCQSKFIAIVTK